MPVNFLTYVTFRKKLMGTFLQPFLTSRFQRTLLFKSLKFFFKFFIVSSENIQYTYCSLILRCIGDYGEVPFPPGKVREVFQ